MAMREEMVENGLKFLQHPNVQSTPLSERVSFLEGKGMTKEEIQEAIERHQNGGTATSAAVSTQSVVQPVQQQQLTTAAPMMMTAAAPMQQMMQRRARYPAYVRVLWMVSSLVGAVSILTFLWNYAVQSGYIPWLRPMPPLLEAAKVQEEKEQEAKKDEALLAELSSVSAAILKQTDELAKLSSSLDEKERDLQSKTLLTAQISSSLVEQGNAQSIAELKAEISTLKALLLSKKTESSAGSDVKVVKESNENTTNQSASTSGGKTAATTSVNPQQPPAVASQVVSKSERMENALKKLRTENSLEQLKLAAGILSMYVKNLVENPDVPRYRRIAPGNANFKQKIEPLKHHEELLKSIGFETTGLNMEWKWHAASKTTGTFDENIAILRALLKALQSLTNPKSSSNLSLEEIAHASLGEFYAGQDKKKDEVASTTTTITTSSTTEEKHPAVQSSKSLYYTTSEPSGPPSTSLDAFMARLEQQTSVSNITANGDVSVKKALSSSSSSNNVGATAAAAAGDDEEKMPVPVVSSISPTVTAGGPSYPESFKEVMDLIQKGETVPGIRDIEDKLSVDSSALLSQQMKAGEAAAAKPWEKITA